MNEKIEAGIPEKTDWETKVGKMKALVKNKRFALAPNEKTKEMIGRAWFKHPLGQKMDGMFFIDADGTVFELDFKKEDFIGSAKEENRFFDVFQKLVAESGFELCALEDDLQKASAIEKEMEKFKKAA